jgi:D-alanyl-D-alanine carboxypeptidase
MPTPLVNIKIESIYTKDGNAVNLPSRMAKCTPDTLKAIQSIAVDVAAKGGKLVLSDLFRSYDMQLQAHADYVNKRKTAYSPPPGGSMHEAGRGMDIDLKQMKIKLADFWVIAAKYGFMPILEKPVSTQDEAWHFDCAGSHRAVYEYYSAGKGNNFKPYKAMAVSGILAIGVKVDDFKSAQKEANIQASLIRMGKEIGNIDGSIGNKTKAALASLGINHVDAATTLGQLEPLLRQRFPGEF